MKVLVAMLGPQSYLSCIFIAYLTLLQRTAEATQDIQEHACYLRNAVISPRGTRRRSLLQSEGEWSYGERTATRWWREAHDADQYIAILDRKPTHELQDAFEKELGNDGTVVHYLPVNSLLIVGTPQAIKRIDAQPSVVHVEHYSAQLKIEPELAQLIEVAASHHNGQSSSGSSADATGGAAKLPAWVRRDKQHHLSIRLVLAGHRESVFSLVLHHVQQALSLACGNHTNSSSSGRGSGALACASLLQGGGDGLSAPPPSPALGELQVGVADLALLPALVEQLAALPFVHWLEALPVVRSRNYQAAAVLQSAAGAVSSDYQPRSSAFPFWAAGINGKGQIVGIGDSGLDYDSCYFKDPKVSQPGPTHRKVVSYRKVNGDTNDNSGHGTHVSGSFVGGSLRGGEAALWNGMAPGARLAFSDFGVLEKGEEIIKDPLGWVNHFAYNYDKGARVHSDSWGGLKYTYDADCAAVDEFTWDNLDFVSIIAAGNDGEETGAVSTIGSPASSKNAISVGASLGLNDTRPQLDYGDVYTAFLVSPDIMEGFTILESKRNKGPKVLRLSGGVYDIVFASPRHGCVAGGNKLKPDSVKHGGGEAVMLKGSILVMELNEDSADCSLVDKTRAAAEIGAAGVLLYPSSAVSFGFPDLAQLEQQGSGGKLVVPAAGIAYSAADVMARVLALGQGVQAIVKGRTQLSTHPYDDIATYSAFGPTLDGRVKPDVVGVGSNVRSALAGDSCGTEERSGTSTAAPIVAGGVALLRQYFTEGWYPSGTGPHPAPTFYRRPSGALLKAVLLNGAQEMRGLTEAGLPLEASPSFRQGWGRVQLNASVPLNPGDWALADVGDDDFDFSETVTVNDDIRSIGSSSEGGGGNSSSGGGGDDYDYSDPATGNVRSMSSGGNGSSSGGNGGGSGNAKRQADDEEDKSYAAPFDLWVRDRAPIATDGLHRYCVRLADNVAGSAGDSSLAVTVWPTELRATLAWYDPPASPSAAVTLINDLDLELLVPPGALNASRGTADYPDRRNTVERAVVRFPVGGASYLVTVSAHNVAKPHPSVGKGQMPYALAITGPPGMRVCNCAHQGCGCSTCPSLAAGPSTSEVREVTEAAVQGQGRGGGAGGDEGGEEEGGKGEEDSGSAGGDKSGEADEAEGGPGEDGGGDSEQEDGPGDGGSR